MSTLSPRFTLGIEEEFQLVDRQTGQLSSRILTLLEKGAAQFGEKIKAEMLQSAIELITDICPNVAALRLELLRLHTALLHLVGQEELTLISAGTHPGDSWLEQLSTPHPRYLEIEEELQDVVRALLIFGLHVHVGVDSFELAITLMNQLRTWIPHLLALSSNSPFWHGRYTGLKSYRPVIWRPFPRSGISDPVDSWSDFEAYTQSLIDAGLIDNAKKIWWDIRPHPFFKTVEFRVFDMPATLDDTVAIAALCQALVAKLTWLHARGMSMHILPRHFIDENKWRAMRYGLDADIFDFVHGRKLHMRDDINDLLDFIDDVLDDLGSRREINYLRALLFDPRGTGADRQIAIFRQTGSIQAVTRFLMEQTLQGFCLDSPEHALPGTPTSPIALSARETG
jgi:glutamate---cysteine ligase / carboxylate-amine ligase